MCFFHCTGLSNGSSTSSGSTSSTGTASSGSVDANKVGIYHSQINSAAQFLNNNSFTVQNGGVYMRPHAETQFSSINDPLTQLHHIEVARILQERSSRAITPMSLPSVRGTPTTAFEIYQTRMNPSRSEQPTPMIQHSPETHLYHNRTPSYTQATQNLPMPFQSPVIHRIYNPIHTDGPVKRRFLQVHHPQTGSQPVFRHEKSGSCSSAISSHGSSSLVAPGVASVMDPGCQSSPELITNPGACFKMKVHGRQSSSSAGRLHFLLQSIGDGLVDGYHSGLGPQHFYFLLYKNGDRSSTRKLSFFLPNKILLSQL